MITNFCHQNLLIDERHDSSPLLNQLQWSFYENVLVIRKFHTCPTIRLHLSVSTISLCYRPGFPHFTLQI